MTAGQGSLSPLTIPGCHGRVRAVSYWMRKHPLRVIAAATLLLCVAGVLGTYYAPRAHVWLIAIMLNGFVVPQLSIALGRNRRR